MTVEMGFKDRVVLITGAGSWLGGVIAEAFAAHHAILACQELTPVNLEETVKRIKATGERAETYIFDLAKKMPVQAMIEQVVADWGRIDILVNNSRVIPRASMLKMDEWDWHRTIDHNLGGPFFVMQSVGRIMQDLGGGVMVNVCEGIDQAAMDSELVAYLASMRGVIGLTQIAARELAAWKVRLNAVCTDDFVLERGFEGRAIANSAEKKNALEETGQAIAREVLFLCSPAAANLNGQVIEIKKERAKND